MRALVERRGPIQTRLSQQHLPWEMFALVSSETRRGVEIRKHVREDKTDSRYYMILALHGVGDGRSS